MKQGNMWAWQIQEEQQSKIDELQQELEAQREETIKGYTKISDLRLERDELQKRVDAVKTLIDEYRDAPTEDKTFRHALSIVAGELEQALRGQDD